MAFDDPPLTRWAGVYCNPRFMFIESLAGYRGAVREHPARAFRTYLEPGVGLTQLGENLGAALRASRFVTPLKEPGLYDRNRIEADYQNWLGEITARYAYPTHLDALLSMAYCHVRTRDGVIAFTPTAQLMAERWDGLEYLAIRIAETATSEQIGAALAQALDRCSSYDFRDSRA